MKERTGKTQEKYPAFMEDQREFFDELITREWESYLNPVWEASRKFEVDRLFERVSARRILDVGCGCGYHDLLMAGKPGVREVVGIDFSAKSIETANRVYPHAKVIRFVADIFGLRRGDFDMAVSFQVVEHTVDALRFLRASAGQVRPGGWVVALTPNRARLQNRFLGLFGKTAPLCDPQHFREFTVEELAQIGREAGLSYQTSFGYGMHFVLTKLYGRIVSEAASLWVGYRLPRLADCLCVIFRYE